MRRKVQCRTWTFTFSPRSCRTTSVYECSQYRAISSLEIRRRPCSMCSMDTRVWRSLTSTTIVSILKVFHSIATHFLQSLIVLLTRTAAKFITQGLMETPNLKLINLGESEVDSEGRMEIQRLLEELKAPYKVVF